MKKFDATDAVILAALVLAILAFANALAVTL
jgi:hypothetical protein